MDEDSNDFDTHLCLVCNQTIVGLMNYVCHKKSECQKQRPAQQQQQAPHPPQSGAYVRGHNLYDQSFSLHNSSGHQSQVLGNSPHSYGLRSQDNVMLSSAHPPVNYVGKSGSFSQHQNSQSTTGQAFSSAQSSSGQSSNAGLTVDVNSPLSSFIDSAFSPGEDSPIDPNSVLQVPESPKARPDFFESLELKSITEAERNSSGSQNRVLRSKRRGLQEEMLDLDLPITMILSNLDFSSDEEGGEVSFIDEDEDSEDSELEWSPPPKTHTGGKWKPGEGPSKIYHRHQPISGKWKPGQGPKNTKRRKTRTANIRYAKPFFCNLCKTTFPDRFSFSGHFSSKVHKEAVEAQRASTVGRRGNQQPVNENPYSGFVLDPVSGEFMSPDSKSDADNLQTLNCTSSSNSSSKKRLFSGPFCETCDLYFDSIMVYEIHCDTKKHKEMVMKKGHSFEAATPEFQNNKDEIQIVHLNKDGNSVVVANKGTKNKDTVHNNVDEKNKELIPETHYCLVCKKTFARKYEMARHLLTHFHKQRAMKHPKALEMLDKYNKYVIRLCPFQCNICQFYFNRPRDLLQHLETREHLISCNDLVGPLLCVTCKYKTHSPDDILEHIRSQPHRETVASHHVCIIRECHSKITCKYCGVHMHSAVRMKRHIDYRHKDRKVQEPLEVRSKHGDRLRCPACQKDYRNKSALLKHYRQRHQKDRPYKCTVCNKSFSEMRRLQVHYDTALHERRIRLKLQGIKEMSPDETEAEITEAEAETTEDSPSDMEVSKTSHFNKKTRKHKGSNASHDKENKNNISISKVIQTVLQTETETLNTHWEQEQGAKAEGSLKEDIINSCFGIVEDKPAETIKGGIKNGVLISPEKIVEMKENEKNTTPNILQESEPTECYSDGNQSLDSSPIEDKTDPEFSVKKHQPRTSRKNIDKSASLFTCEHCEYSGENMEELKNHYMTAHPSNLITCEPCDQFFLSVKAYKIHCAGGTHQGRLNKLISKDNRIALHVCPHCSKKYSDEKMFQLHVEFVHLHISTEEAVARLCQGRDMVTQLYGEHLRQLENISHDSSVSCPECGKFFMKNNLIEHLRTHTGERPFKCRHCMKNFGSRMSLRRHLIEHIGESTHKCETCGKEFKKRSAYTFHLRLHVSEKKGLKFDCEVCNASFLLESQLIHHKKRHGDRNFKCTEPGCHWTFVLRTELEQHTMTHTGEKKFLCDICGYAATTKTRLKRHAKNHQAAREIPCEYCPYKAGCKTHLRRHMRIHVGCKPFKCLYCAYACNTHENIRKHILKTKKHQGLNIYPCKFCKFQSNEAREFKKHLMVDHLEYLKARPSESLVKFTGLYHPEEDVTQPPEGGEILRVMKGRFIKVYDGTRLGGTGEAIGPAKKKSSKSAKRNDRPQQQSFDLKAENAELISVHSQNADPQERTVNVSIVPAQQEQATTSSVQHLDVGMVYPQGLPWTVVTADSRVETWLPSQNGTQVIDVSHGNSAFRNQTTLQVISDPVMGAAYLNSSGGMPSIVTMVNVDSHSYQTIEPGTYQVISTPVTHVTALTQ